MRAWRSLRPPGSEQAPSRRSWARIFAQALIDAIVIGLVIVFAIRTSNVFERLGLFAAAWLLLTGKFLVLGDRK
jgi:hypothetical protein